MVFGSSETSVADELLVTVFMKFWGEMSLEPLTTSNFHVMFPQSPTSNSFCFKLKK